VRRIDGVDGNVAGVVEAVVSVVGAAADVSEEVIDTDRIYATSVVMAVKLLKLTVNVKSPAMAAKSGMIAILFVGRAVRTPPTWRATVDESWAAVYLGVYPR